MPPPGGYHTKTRGRCAQNELCMTRGNPQDNNQVALCIPQNVGFRLQEAAYNNNLRRVLGRINRGAGPSSTGYALILSGQHDDVLFKASAISITPRDSSYKPTAQPISCTSCSHLSFQKSPPSSESFEMDITLPNAHDIAVLHDFAWAS
ncbi:hypothetical protein EV356DRAFT_512771 [Viridothelium virens]|uniref:Uncharacterized protein n=1 Tax=Viridothelium virens TaxID=1048519 RepID=A0A6A6HF49_VIRVR|nr:hypothetical protein EV356DRAFT_512771 [Viridothelium virens]